MKKKTILFLALLALAGSALAQTPTFGLGSEAVTVKQGLTTELGINFADETELYTAGQISVTLPEGITIEGATFYEERDYLDEGGTAHTVTIGAPNEENTSILMVASTSGNCIFQDVTNGKPLLFTITLKAAVSVEPGTYTGRITGIRFAMPFDGKEDRYVDFDPVNFSIVVEEGAIVTLDENSTVEPEAKTGVSVVLKRTMRAEGWNTICLPFQLTAAKVKELFGDDTKVCQFNSATTDENGTTTVTFTNWSRALAKNTPYLIKPGKSGTSYTIENVSIEPTTVSVAKGDVTFIGTYVGGQTVPTGDYFLNNNTFYESAGASTIGGFRGYFHLGTGNARMRLSIDGQESVVTGIGTVGTVQDEPGDVYNLRGQKVSTPRKGIYVKNNKKISIKR